ncbi:MAG: phage holin family protein [Armatimonadota bacterium]
MRWLVRWAVGALALWLTVAAAKEVGVRGLALESAVGAFVAIAALGFANHFIRPVLVLIAFPLNCLTLGLFRLVINALLFQAVGALHVGLVVEGFLPAVFGSITLSVVSAILDFALPDPERK